MKIRQRMTSQTGRAGLTLIELLLAVAGTGFVAAAVAMMLSAIATGTNSRNDLRQSVVRQKTIMARLTAAIRSSHMVLAADDDLLVLWTSDADGSETPNLGEIRRIERDAATGELRSYVAPLDLAPGANTEFSLATDFEAATDGIKGDANFPEDVWATGLTSWTITINADAAQDASLVSSRIVVGPGNIQETIIGAAALRNRGTTSFIHASGEMTSSDVTDEGGGVDSDDDDDHDDEGKSKGKGKGKGDDDDD